MSRLSWQNSLQQKLLRLRANKNDPRVALIGIGQTLRGDDAAGILLARLLQPLADVCEELLVVCAGSAPENCTGLLRRYGPDLVVLVDAAQLDDVPGAIQWIPSNLTSGLSASTHTLPLHLLASYLEAELDCEVGLLGIQPSQLAIGPMSPLVRTRVSEMARVMERIFRSSISAASGIRQSDTTGSIDAFDRTQLWSLTNERERKL